jgi:hypothetical protein
MNDLGILEIVLPCIRIEPPTVKGGGAGFVFDHRTIGEDMHGVLEELFLGFVLAKVLDLAAGTEDGSGEIHGNDLRCRIETQLIRSGFDLTGKCLQCDDSADGGGPAALDDLDGLDPQARKCRLSWFKG